MPPRTDVGTSPSFARFSRLLLLFLLSPMSLAASGCFFWRAAHPETKRESSEFRGASAQNTQPPVITPPPSPKTEKPTSDEDSPLRRLARRAADGERNLNDYMVRVRRRETIDGTDQPLEIVLCKYRRAPFSIHCKWLGDEAKGRELIFVRGQHDDKIHLLTGQGDMFGAGRQMSFSPDSPLVRAKFRYPITDAGLGPATQRFIALADAVERGQTTVGSAKYLGKQNRPEFPRPMETVEHTIPLGQEPALEKGGVRFYYFDDTLGLPTLIVTFDHNRHQVEYYCFDRLQAPIRLDDADFDPAKLWPKK